MPVQPVEEQVGDFLMHYFTKPPLADSQRGVGGDLTEGLDPFGLLHQKKEPGPLTYGRELSMSFA